MRDRNAPLSKAGLDELAWAKMDGLLPAVVQDAATYQILMLGYMDRAALVQTIDSGLVTFYSRSKQRLWQKGETSGNHLAVRAVFPDCDGDALLIHASPAGPTCHLGTASCFGPFDTVGIAWLARLGEIVHARALGEDRGGYTARLLEDGLARIAQKVGEEGVEVALAAVTRDAKSCVEETADLLYHLTVLMEAKGYGWDEVAACLQARHV